MICFGTYNICNGRNGGLKSALRGMSQENIKLGVLQDTNLTGGVYMREYAGYRVAESGAPRQHCRGAAIFYPELL